MSPIEKTGLQSSNQLQISSLQIASMRVGLRDDLFRHNELCRQLVPAQSQKRVRAGHLRQRAAPPQTGTTLPVSPEEVDRSHRPSRSDNQERGGKTMDMNA